ncbi:ca2+ transporting sarcoplasmic endoplasmic reticulum [Fusarium sporotrichioides]|uniref:Ca2+ transporting sarcoplasmic endoplasmic reticulum n=1 Tax=Fusarium sporotrichioides TaxID=5514 RepID=A0A395SCW0_FUSSP|nr:ca2+ transporting sarcoplasmic endoplasmic reticulum [Fusarium sporotrichioides]
MSSIKDPLEARCRRIWEGMCRDWATVVESKRKRDAQKQEDEKRRLMEADDSSEDGVVEDVDSDDDETPVESSDITMFVNDYNYEVNSVIDQLLEPLQEDRHQYWERMDVSLGRLFNCDIPSWEKSNLEPVTRAISIVKRLPKSSLPLSSDLWSTLESDVAEGAESSTHTSRESQWEKHEATTMVDSNTIRLALLTAFLGQKSHRGICDTADVYSNLLSEIMDRITAKKKSASMKDDRSLSDNSYHNARVFVWTAWQRWLQVSGYYLFGTRLGRERIDEDWDGPSSDKPYRDLESCAIGNSMQVVDQAEVACNYMCRHSFDLVRRSISGSHDLRTVIDRYNSQFGQENARCERKGSTWYPCKPSMAFCTRCIEASPEDQSAHDRECVGRCQKLVWDEESYRNVELGFGRSVDISLPRENATLKYRRATDLTLAISHVWSHGQGGRPEDGFNECLHNRYTAIASRLGCDSYWIDAACIPSDELLRAEAIKTINPTFTNSKVTLICDKDIMSIDVQDMSKEQCETLISVLLLSDWNIRAWTLLEGIRGNRSIHLLTKGNKPVPLKDVLSVLYEEGSIDLCGILLGSPHILPMGEEVKAVELEKAGVMLSRRFASRPGDDIIIWGLLCDDQVVVKKPDMFWRNRLNCSVKSGFLMSTCQRVKGVRGLSWAPSSPFADPLAMRISSASSTPSDIRIYAPYDGSGTDGVKPMEVSVRDCNTALHLRGYWCVYVVLASDLSQTPRIPNSCWDTAGKLLQSKEYKRVILIRPVFAPPYQLTDRQSSFTGSQHTIHEEDAPVAVCATKDDQETFDPHRLATELIETNELWGEEWEWKGVFKVAPAGSIKTSNFQVRILRII